MSVDVGAPDLRAYVLVLTAKQETAGRRTRWFRRDAHGSTSERKAEFVTAMQTGRRDCCHGTPATVIRSGDSGAFTTHRRATGIPGTGALGPRGAGRDRLNGRAKGFRRAGCALSDRRR